jgi:hypothetical protein
MTMPAHRGFHLRRRLRLASSHCCASHHPHFNATAPTLERTSNRGERVGILRPRDALARNDLDEIEELFSPGRQASDTERCHLLNAYLDPQRGRSDSGQLWADADDEPAGFSTINRVSKTVAQWKVHDLVDGRFRL